MICSKSLDPFMQAVLYSGTGNLLWVLEVPASAFDIYADDHWSQLALTLNCEQGDGLMIVTDAAPYRVRFFNPDGSDGVLCGNGLRCVAFYLVKKKQLQQPFTLIMAGQEIRCEVKDDQVTIALPKQGVQYLGLMTLQVFPDLDLTGFRINMPNPHWVIFAEISEQELIKIGRRIAVLYQDAGGVNVEFVFKNPKAEWQVLVYERGAGITQACGSGAMAVLCVLQHESLMQQGALLQLRMSGGVLMLQDLGSHLSLTGQVQFIKEKKLHAL
jgi:diaminopimelate epimerase